METIVNISTPPGTGAISIIKASGKDAITLVNKYFKGKDLTTVNSHSVNYGYIIDGDILIDEVLVTVMKAPRTYTGEDVVEINCHGGNLITNKILKLLLKDMRLSKPGEFTQRAFLNNKKSFEETQIIMDVIDAKSEGALNIAIGHLNDSSKNLIEDLRELLLQIVTNIEVNIDYPEYEDLEIIKNKDVKEKIEDYKIKVDDIIRDTKSGEIIKNGIRTAIIGKPNVGKSSLLNYLSKKEKAIVTDIKGTTRDIIESEIILDNLILNLVDTAGIRDTDDIVEKLGVKKSIEQINDADLVLFVIDNNILDKSEKEIFKIIKESNKKYIVLLNKSDEVDYSRLDELFDDSITVLTSAKDSVGSKELSSVINKIFEIDNFDTMKNKALVNVENLSKIENVRDIIYKVEEALNNEEFLDLILVDLKEALFILSDILGLETKEDYLNEMFSRFCLGK